MGASFVDAAARRLAARSTRRAALAGGAALAAAGLAAHAVAQETTPAASPAAGGSTLAHPDAEFLFVQVALAATWAPKEGADGVFTLALAHEDGQTVYFSGRPARIVGSAPTPNILDALGFSAAGAAVTPAGPIDACWDYFAVSCDACDGRSEDDLYDLRTNAYPVCSGYGGCYVSVGY